MEDESGSQSISIPSRLWVDTKVARFDTKVARLVEFTALAQVVSFAAEAPPNTMSTFLPRTWAAPMRVSISVSTSPCPPTFVTNVPSEFGEILKNEICVSLFHGRADIAGEPTR